MLVGTQILFYKFLRKNIFGDSFFIFGDRSIILVTYQLFAIFYYQVDRVPIHKPRLLRGRHARLALATMLSGHAQLSRIILLRYRRQL